jgi:hypothetical protein
MQSGAGCAHPGQALVNPPSAKLPTLYQLPAVCSSVNSWLLLSAWQSHWWGRSPLAALLPEFRSMQRLYPLAPVSISTPYGMAGRTARGGSSAVSEKVNGQAQRVAERVRLHPTLGDVGRDRGGTGT